ncbi:MAG: transporter substrate-binding domain-containing protein [Alphaproteobacteria bacterium]|nr:transporter substrate-binding domain-containing protein [Alphaproteobacteria bacterium]
MTDTAPDPRIANIVKAGCIRPGLFLPQYALTKAGDLNPVGAGVVAHGLIGTLAEHLGIEMQIVQQPSPPKAVETLNAGGCDILIMGIEASRTEIVDFTPPVIQFDYAYLVPTGSPINETAEVDRPGHRISVPGGHASWMALKRKIIHAEIVETDIPDESFALLCDGKTDVFALPREQLIDYAAELPGSRILTEGFGVNDVGLAVAKGQSQRLAFINEFVKEAKASGLVQRILEEAKLTSRGFNVAL